MITITVAIYSQHDGDSVVGFVCKDTTTQEEVKEVIDKLRKIAPDYVSISANISL